MRCVHFMTAVLGERGGPVRAALDLCAALAAAGERVTFVTTNGRDLPLDWHKENQNPRALVLPGLYRPAEWLPPTTLAHIARALAGADVLHIHELWCLGSLQVAWLARCLGVPYVLSLHGSLNRWGMAHGLLRKRAFLRLVGAPLLAGAAAVHCASQGELDKARPFLAGRDGVVVPYLCRLDQVPVPKEQVAAQVPAFAGPLPVVLFLGRVVASKGAGLLVRAVARAAQAGRPFALVLAGPGPAAYLAGLRADAARLGVADLLTLPGMVDGALKAGLLQHSDLLCLPTEHESFGIALVEALAAGLPVITTPGAPLAREMPEAGMVVAERSADALWSAIDALLARPAERRALGRRGRDAVLTALAPGRVLSMHLEMYRDLTG